MGLLEVLVALSLLAVVVLCSFDLQHMGLKSSEKARRVQQATQMVSRNLEVLRSLPFEQLPDRCPASGQQASGPLRMECALVPCQLEHGNLSCPGLRTDAYRVRHQVWLEEISLLTVTTVIAP